MRKVWSNFDHHLQQLSMEPTCTLVFCEKILYLKGQLNFEFFVRITTDNVNAGDYMRGFRTRRCVHFRMWDHISHLNCLPFIMVKSFCRRIAAGSCPHEWNNKLWDIYISLILRYVKYVWSNYYYEDLNATFVATHGTNYKCNYVLLFPFLWYKRDSVL